MLGNRKIHNPSNNTLLQMFDDSNDVGDFAIRSYKNKIKNGIEFKDRIFAICDYAEELHKAQSDYYWISPYGGLDITVQPIDEIAVKEIFSVGYGIYLKDACRELFFELTRRNIPLIYVEDIIKSFQELKTLPEKLKKEYNEYLSQCSRYAQKVQDKKLEIQKEAEQKYLEYKEQLDILQSSSLRRLLGKFNWTQTHKKMAKLETLESDALITSMITEQDVIEKYFSDEENPIYYAPSYWFPFSGDVDPEMKVILSDSDLQKAIQEINEQLSDEENIKAYKQCLFFIDANKEHAA